MKVLVISTLVMFYTTSCIADNHLPVNIPPGVIAAYERSGGTDREEWKYDKRIIEGLGEIMKLFEDKWSSKISHETEDEPKTPSYMKCPNAWPFHDAWPVTEPPCDLDSECEEGRLCCQLFLKHYCLEGIDSRPRTGECPTPEPSTVPYNSRCQLDEAGCFYDAECGGSKKCCAGDCDYKQCVTPSNIRQSPQTQADETTTGHAYVGRSEIQRRLQLLSSRRSNSQP